MAGESNKSKDSGAKAKTNQTEIVDIRDYSSLKFLLSFNILSILLLIYIIESL